MKALLIALALFMIVVLAMAQDTAIAPINSIIDTKTLHKSVGEKLVDEKKLKPQQFSDPSKNLPVISDPAPISLNPKSIYSPNGEDPMFSPIVKSVPKVVVEVPENVVPVKVAPKKSPVIDAPVKADPVFELPARDDLVIEIPKKAAPVIEVPVKSVPVIDVPKKVVPVSEVPVKSVPVIDVPKKVVPVSEVPEKDAPVINPVKDIPPIDIPVKSVPVVNIAVKDTPVKVVPVVKVPVKDIPVKMVPVKDAPVIKSPQPVKHAPIVHEPIVVDSPDPKSKNYFFYDNEINDHNAKPAEPVSNDPEPVSNPPPSSPVVYDYPWSGVTINGRKIGSMQMLAIMSGLFVAVLLCMACVMYKLGQWSMTFNSKGSGGIYSQVAIESLSNASSTEDLI